MKSNGIRKMYEPSLPVPTLYVDRVEDLLQMDGYHSALATLMVMPPLPFHKSTQHDRSRPSIYGVPTVKVLHHAGAAMIMRHTWMKAPASSWRYFKLVAKTGRIHRQSSFETSQRA
jgi:hypothetical protein